MINATPLAERARRLQEFRLFQLALNLFYQIEMLLDHF